MSQRPKRRVKIKSKVPIQPPRRWKDEEMEALLNCLQKYGHKNLNKIQESLPMRSIENIKSFIRTVHDTAGKMEEHNGNVDKWIKLCESGGGETSWKDCIQIAQVLKYLSVDGLLENHPLPERCQGIDFRQAYRLMYQAMMGYPLQPVNKATADFVTESLAELSGEIKKLTDAIKKVDEFLNCDSKTKEPDKSEASCNGTNSSLPEKKPLRVYQRKRPALKTVEGVPSLKITVKENPSEAGSGAGTSKGFCVTVEGSEGNSHNTVNVPMPYQKPVDEDALALHKSLSYNPFQLPEKWLEEPLYLNLVQAL